MLHEIIVRPLKEMTKWNINWKIINYQKAISNEFEIFKKANM
jgi:hypothetical protein